MPSRNTKKRRHRARNILRTAMATPWAIEPEKLLALQEVLELAANGQRFEEAEVQQRIGLAGGGRDRKAYQVVNGVAVLPFHGVTAPRMNLFMKYSGGVSTQLVAGWFTEALHDPAVKAIVLDIDSPGGSALGNEELSDLIFAARGKKPIKAVVTGLGASAAYYVGSSCDQLIASPSSYIGSIGTLSIFVDSTEADAKEGRKITAVHAGKFKADGHLGLDPQTRATIQERVDDYYAQFITAVARNRGVTPKAVESDFGQGKAFIASRALEMGMVDRIARLDQVVAELSGSSSQTIHTPAPQSPAPHPEDCSVNPKITAALYACGLTANMEASEEVCDAALNAFFTARGEDRPDSDEAILAALSAGFAQRSQANASQSQTGESQNAAAANASSASASTTSAPTQTAAQIRAEERRRMADIRSSADLLGVSDEDVEAAIESGDDIEAIRNRWVEQAAQSHQPLRRESVEVDGSAFDTFVEAATDAVLEMCDARTSNEPLSTAARDLTNAGFMEIAKQTLRLRNIRAIGNNEEIAAQFLKQGGDFRIGSMEASFNRAGDYPNLLSNLAGKILDNAIDLAEATYPLWTAKLQDLADFKPKSIVAIGQFDELDELGDDEKATQLTLDEEMVGWIKIDRYGGKFGLTAVMVANDDLDAFGQGLRSMMIAHENTVNRLCLNLLVGNVTMVDGNQLFSSAHGNDVSPGAVISATQLKTMRLKHRQQSGIGGKGKVKTKPAIVLNPASLETDTEQVLGVNLVEHKSPQTDATVNTFRGTLRQVTEPDLDDFSDKKWYTIANPKVRRTIVHAFMRGYGRGGKRTSFYDPDAETRWVKLEGRCAAAVGGYRGIVRNAGE